MADSPYARILTGPQIRTAALVNGRVVVVVEPLRWVELTMHNFARTRGVAA